MSARAGIDLGGTKIQVVVVDSQGEVLGQARRPTPTEGGPPDVAAAMAEAVEEAARSASCKPSQLAGIGVGSPGSVDADAGAVSQSPNLPNWEESFALGPELERLLGSKVALGNDVAVATLGEFELGAAKDVDSFLMISWGTGVGGGLVLDGKPWTGLGDAGEIGHMCVKIDGRRCGCGRRGCMEAYAGRKSMEQHARKLVEQGHKTDLFKIMEERGRDRLTSGVWARALKHHDKLANELIAGALEAIGAGAASAINLLDIDTVVIGGGLGTRFGQGGADRIERAMMPHLFNDQRPPKVQVAALGDLGGAIGAALLVERP
jgi:glucokinase